MSTCLPQGEEGSPGDLSHKSSGETDDCSLWGATANREHLARRRWRRAPLCRWGHM